MANNKTQAGKMQDRAMATRGRLLEATAQALVECGYAGTTTHEVCRRAKASRGTLLHHFSTREQLVVEAVEYVLEKNTVNFQKTVAELLHENFTMPDLARALWDKHWTSDTFYAWLELTVASRTDPVLNKKVKSMEARWSAKLSSSFQSIVSHELEGPFELFLIALNGLSITRINSDPSRVKAALDALFAGVDFFDRFLLRYGAKHDQNHKP